MMQRLLFIPCLFASLVLSAQPDDYTQGLVDFLSVQYTLTGESYPYYDSEAEFRTQSGSYGLTRTNETAAGQDFTNIINLRVPQEYPSIFQAGWNIANTEAINEGDKVLFVLYLRAKPNDDGDATARANIFVERSTDFLKEFEIPVEVGQDWQRYFIRVDMQNSYAAGRLIFGLHVGYERQDVQVGGLSVLNYGPDVPLEILPQNLNVSEYGGFEDDAPWRAEAAQRIDALRKADLNLTVVDVDGSAMANTNVAVRMEKHDFEFGTAVKGSRFPGGREYNETFVQNLFNLDGQGHGFNAVVFENDFKWPAWEQEWVTSNRQMRRTLDYLVERDIHIRGHVLLWPGWRNMPDRMRDNADNVDYLKGQIDAHLVKMLQTEDFDTKVTDWDVINEINTNVDLAAALAGKDGYVTGREIYPEIFQRARELAPDAELYLNDYITLSAKNAEGSILYDQFQTYIQEIVDGDAPIDGIGFQAHMSGSPNGIYEVENVFDDFYNRFGLDHKVTEFDMRTATDSTLAKAYLGDFLTMTFSHPSMKGFMFWNWWDVDTWQNKGANLYDPNWNEKAPHQVFTDLVFKDWWTNEDLTTDAAGLATLRGFKGEYTIALTCDGQEVSTRIAMTDDLDLTLDCAQLLTSINRPTLPAGSVTISPNPGKGPINLVNVLPMQLEAELYDLTGRKVWAGLLDHGARSLDIYLVPGTYQLRFSDGVRSGVERVVRQ